MDIKETWLLFVGIVGGVGLDRLIITYQFFKTKNKIYNWLKSNTSKKGYHFRSTSAIATGTNFPEAKVAEACYSYTTKMRRNKNPKTESWTIFLDSDNDNRDFRVEIWN